jgi:hypothetical protein
MIGQGLVKIGSWAGPELVGSWILKENLPAILYWFCIIPNCNLSSYANNNYGSYFSSKSLLWATDYDRNPQLAKMQRTTHYRIHSPSEYI